MTGAKHIKSRAKLSWLFEPQEPRFTGSKLGSLADSRVSNLSEMSKQCKAGRFTYAGA
jgi:hypothetical protein